MTYYARVKAVDRAGNVGDYSTTSDGITLDVTEPSAVAVADDGGYTNMDDLIHVSWTSSIDNLSGIKTYEYALGTAPGETDIRSWTDAGLITDLAITGIDLKEGNTYFVSIRAINGAGIRSEVSSSNGITIDTTKPVGPFNVTIPDYVPTPSITWKWPAASDSLSGVMGYYVSIGTSPGATNIMDNDFVKVPQYVYPFGVHNKTYYCTVVTVDNAGNLGTATSAEEVTVDTIAPRVSYVDRESEYAHEKSLRWSWTGSDDLSGISGYHVIVGTTPDPGGEKNVISTDYYVETGNLLEGHTYYIKVRPEDRAGNLGDWAFGQGITLDSISPTGKVFINDNATSVNTRFVTLRIESTHSDVYQMVISNSIGFEGSSWEPYLPARAWYLTPGDGQKTVYVRLKDRAGLLSENMQYQVVLDTIIPDLKLDPLDEFTSEAEVSVGGETEPGTKVYINGEPVEIDSKGRFSKKIELSEGTNIITVAAEDPAGNTVEVSRTVTREAFYIGTGPLLALVIILLLLMLIAVAFAYSAKKQVARMSRRAPPPEIRPAKKKVKPEKEEEIIVVDRRAGTTSDLPEDELVLEPGEEEDLEEDEEVLEDDEEEVEVDEELEMEEEPEIDEEPELEITEEVALKKPLLKVRCTDCGDILPIYTKDRPLTIECPTCGKRGMIR
jgi:hypothetical protein